MFRLARTGAGTLALVASAALAQTTPSSSAFDGYQPFADQEVGSWKDANDNVGRIGGWRAYAREAQAQAGAPAAAASAPARAASAPARPASSAASAPATPASGAAPAKDPHAGHH